MIKKIFLSTTFAVLFIVLTTLHPYFLWGKINLFELGLYLPGIDSILNGQIPFKDFFCLRGPMELYLPALLMKIFGANVSILASYFYVGTVLSLIFSFFIAKECYQKKWFLFSFLPVLVARTFPRVVFTFWGGMRYAWGLLALWYLVKYCNTQKKHYLFFTGLISAIAGFTSIDIGASIFIAVLAVFGSLFFSKKTPFIETTKNFFIFLSGALAFTLPLGLYLYQQHAIIPYYEMIKEVLWVTSRMSGTIPQGDSVPHGFGEYFLALINPAHSNFKHMTPFYCYIFFFLHAIYLFVKKRLSLIDISMIGIAIYGLTLFLSSFRNIGAANFEMALQVEKIVLFFLFEKFYFFITSKKLSPKTIGVLVFLLIGSSWGYSIDRYNKRFFAVRWLTTKAMGKSTDGLRPLNEEKTITLDLKRINHMTVPQTQGKDIQQLEEFISQNTEKHEPVFMFPELGTMHFIVNRPSVGRFPHVTLSWFSEKWHQEVMQALKEKQPRYAVINKTMPEYFDIVYFPVESSKRKFDETMQYISDNYVLEEATPSYNIFRRKN